MFHGSAAGGRHTFLEVIQDFVDGDPPAFIVMDLRFNLPQLFFGVPL